MSHHLSYDVMSDIIYSRMSAGFCDAHDLDNNDPESYRRCTTIETKVCKRNGTTDRKTPKQTCTQPDSWPFVYPEPTVNVKEYLSYPYLDLKESFFLNQQEWLPKRGN